MASAELFQFAQHGKRRGRVLQHRGLGDFELQSLRRQTGRRQGRADIEAEAVALELDRREVDGDLRLGRPLHRIGACFFQHPAADFVDQADLLQHRNEDTREHEAARRAVPAQQRFEADHFARRDIHQRLIEELEFAVRERLGQIGFQRAPIADLRVHGLLEEAMHAAAVRFRAIERHVGAFQQRIEIRPMVRRDGDADTRCRS